MSVVILGAGISGLSCAFHLNEFGIQSNIFERNPYPGGMCHSLSIDGFTFDQGAHLSFTKDEYVKSFFLKSTPIVTHHPTCSNYYKGTWIKHPAQNNLFPLPQWQKDQIIKSFSQRPDFDLAQIKNYQEWLEAQYGHYFANEFPAIYTRKYWCLEPKEMCIDWIGPRMNRPSLEDLERGASAETGENHYYIQEMRYPSYGGYKGF
ncbi:MAG: NAD(P)-binding protein [Bdellovibrionales bacterium]|nr:NAD(P)-binding protein [Bdellovibrionales bacterium]